MPPHQRANKNRERLIWGLGEHADIDFPIGASEGITRKNSRQIDSDPEIQEISPPPGYKRKQYTPQVPSRREEKSALSQSALGWPQSPNATPRRSRGPDAGKSIHRAAEASQASSRAAVLQSQGRRPSVGSAKRIVPSLPSNDIYEGDSGRHTPKSPTTTIARKTVAGGPSGPSRERGLGTPASTAENNVEIIKEVILGQTSNRDQGRLLDNDFYHARLHEYPALRNRRQQLLLSPSPLESAASASTAYQVQLARKTVSNKPAAQPLNVIRHHPPLPLQRIKAARKTSAQRTTQSSLGSDWSDDSGSRSSDNKSNKSRGGDEGTDTSPSSSSSCRSISDQVGFGRIKESHEEVVSRDTSQSHVERHKTLLLEAGDIQNLSLSPSGTTLHEPGNFEPPQDLVSAFEAISGCTVQLHVSKRLPFLLRNVRAGFLSWCQQLHVEPDRHRPLETHDQVALKLEYVDPSGRSHTYNTEIEELECPLCSIFGIFSSWEALKMHVRWDHEEVDLEAKTGENAPYVIESMVVRISVQPTILADVAIREVKQPKKKAHTRNIYSIKYRKFYRKPPLRKRKQAQLNGLHASPHKSLVPNEDPVPEEAYRELVAPESEPKIEEENVQSRVSQDRDTLEKNSPTSRSQSQSRPDSITTESKHIVTSNGASNSRRSATPEPSTAAEIGALRSSVPPHSSLMSCVPTSQLQWDTESQIPRPPPPPASDPHGPSLPVAPGHPLPQLANPVSYRPTGPHLYDHLAGLPLDTFGHQSWFVLDKEEEIFELTDVLDEDKVVCALWARWILLNRSFFISNYLLGVEAFVEEYWLIIHQAAGWGALRAWLLMLVSRRFLKNVDMVQVLKKYNGLIGKSKWPKDVRDQ